MVFNSMSTIFFIYIVAVSFIGGGNRSTRRKPPTAASHRQLHNVVPSAHRHEHDSNSQLSNRKNRRKRQQTATPLTPVPDLPLCLGVLMRRAPLARGSIFLPKKKFLRWIFAYVVQF